MSTQPQDGPGLTAVQTAVVEAISRGASLSAIARSAKIHRSTVYNWLAQPAFAAAVQEARDAYVEELRDSLRDLAALALSRLRTLLLNPDTPPSVQLKAALAVLNRPCFPDPGWQLPERVDSPDRHPAPGPDPSLHAGSGAPPSTGNAFRNRSAAQAPAPPAPAPPNSAPPAAAPCPSPAPAPPDSAPPAAAPCPSASPAPPPGTPRGAPCPCGSKQKFKRCCGRSAPAQQPKAA